MSDDVLGIGDVIWTAEGMLCPKGEPHTGDDNRIDHGHTLCWVLGGLLNEVDRLRDEVQHVRVALLLAVKELFTHREYGAWTHEMLFNQFLEEAHRD